MKVSTLALLAAYSNSCCGAGASASVLRTNAQQPNDLLPHVEASLAKSNDFQAAKSERWKT